MTERGVALVTGGAGGGSGGAISRRFASAGFLVLICDNDDQRAASEVEAIARYGGRAFVQQTDVRSKDALAEAYARARSLGNLRAVVNNASAVSAFDANGPLEAWDEFASVDFLGTMWSTRFAVDALRATGGGGIVNVSSTSALPLRGGSHSPLYDVAKKAVLQLSARLAFLHRENIRVNCIVPHWIAAPHIVEYVARLSLGERLARGVPERLIPVEDIAEASYRLATDETLAGEILVWPDGGTPVPLTDSPGR